MLDYKDYIFYLFLINGVLSSLIIGILIVLVLGVKSEILDQTISFETPCIKLTDTTGFKNKPDSSKIEPCDPSNNSPSPTILSSILNGSASYDLSGNSNYKWSNFIAGIGIFSNILLICSPYFNLISKNFTLLISLLMNFFKEEVFKKKISSPQETNVRELEGGGKFSDNFEMAHETLNKLSKFINEIAQDDRDYSGDSLRLLYGVIHIIIILILNSLIKGYPLNISSGLFTLFISIFCIFLFLQENMKNISILIAIITFIIGIILIIFNLIIGKEKTLLSPFYVISYSSFFISLISFLYVFSENNSKEKDKPKDLKYFILEYFKKLNNSLTLRIIKVFIILMGILFTPNYYGNKLKDILQSLYQSRLTIFIIISLLFIIIFDGTPFLQLILKLILTKTPEDDPENLEKHENSIYKEGSKISDINLFV